jgi:hypothetical protein
MLAYPSNPLYRKRAIPENRPMLAYPSNPVNTLNTLL